MVKITSIQVRIGLWAGGAILAVSAILASYAIYSGHQTQQVVQQKTRQLLINAVEEQLTAQSANVASAIKNSLDKGFVSAQTLALSAVSLARQQSSSASIREQLNGVLRETVLKSNDYLGVFSLWEANALDDNDFAYQGLAQEGYDDSGRFIPYWAKDGQGGVELSALVDFENYERNQFGVRAGEYYLCPKESLSPCIIDPYIYSVGGKDTLLTSLSVPIIDDGNFLGVVGVDMSLSFINQLAKKTSMALFDGQSRVTIVSYNGAIAGDSQDAISGQHLKSLMTNGWAQSLAKIRSGTVQVDSQSSHDDVTAQVPVYLGHSKTPWAILVSVPKSVVLAPMNTLHNKMAAMQNASRWWQGLVSALTCLVGVLVIWRVAAGIVKPIKETVTVLNIAAGGDLTPRMATNRRDEIGELADACNTLLDKTQPLISEVVESSNHISSSAEQSSVIATQTQQGVKRQHQETTMLATAAEEMVSTSLSVAKMAEEAQLATGDAQTHAMCGQEVLTDTIKAIEDLSSKVLSAAGVITQLEADSNNIHTILDVIRSIADQTNLLALNAAIEAARAGQQGRGFAVVADEVRTLAQRTQESTGEIQEMIEQLQRGTTQAVNEMAQGQLSVRVSIEKGNEAGQALSNILESVNHLNTLNTEVASAASQQQSVASSFNDNLVTITQVAQQAASGSQESANSSENLIQLSHRLKSLVVQFTV